MNGFSPLIPRRGGVALALLATILYATSAVPVSAADGKPADSKAASAQVATKTAPKKKAIIKLTGAQLYAINCNRCHPERYPTEWNSAQWKTLVTHMRVRANLPAAQAKEILKYLQEDSGN